MNGQNGKGQTALHMSVEYDCIEQTKWLIAQGVNQQLQNNDGHPAITGIEGSKVGAEAWDAPINHLKGATDEASLAAALAILEKADAKDIDKAALVQTGHSRMGACSVFMCTWVSMCVCMACAQLLFFMTSGASRVIAYTCKEVLLQVWRKRSTSETIGRKTASWTWSKSFNRPPVVLLHP